LTDRILGIAASADRSSEAAILAAFRLFIAMHVTAETWLWALSEAAGFEQPVRLALAAFVTGCLLASQMEGWQRRALLAMFAALAVEQVWVFPVGANHFFLEMVLVGALAFFDTERDEREGELFLLAARWMTVIVLFYTGLQKVLYGTYFDGQFLAFQLANGDRFGHFFALLDPSEVERLRTLAPVRPGAGPFRLESPVLLVASNLVWVLEMALPALMLWRRTRHWALFVSGGFVIMLQLGAQEVMFSVLFANLCLLFADRPYNRWLLPVLPLVYLYLIGARLGYLPGEMLN